MHVVRWVRSRLPRGRGVPAAVWTRRHRGLLILLTVQCVVLAVVAAVTGAGPVHALVDVLPIVLAIAVARSTALSPLVRSTACALGLVVCSAVLVHLASGFIEAHFHFFVMVALLSLYQAWLPFAVAVVFVALHHGVMGVVFPTAVYNHDAAIANPWLWALIHSGLLLAACAACLITWRLNEHQALHDALTGLPNRALLSERLEVAIARSGTEPIAVLFLDLDDFKGVNDRGGHVEGDHLLDEVGRRLQRSVRAGDLVARIGGDEFAALLHGVDGDAASAVIERMNREIAEPIDVGGRPACVTASIGVALCNDPSEDAESVLSKADMAMYVAKRRGKANHQHFTPAVHDELIERLELQADLHDALAKGQFVLEYQPILDIGGQYARGIETLVRWQHPTRGLVPPTTFIPLAEESDVIVPLGSWILRQAATQMAEWVRTSGEHDAYISVNVSPRQLRHDLAEVVHDVLTETGLDPRHLVLELTESALVDDAADVGVLERLRASGVRIAVDDFGTGYSSLSYLRELPIDVVKIDRSFVQDVTQGGTGEALIDAIVHLCGALDLQVIAEGVETQTELDVLRDLGVPSVQGFLFARPRPADQQSPRFSAPTAAATTSGT